jgi:hypothetical protein
MTYSAGLKHSQPVTVIFDSCPDFPEEGVVSAMALISRTDKPIRLDVSNIERDRTHR